MEEIRAAADPVPRSRTRPAWLWPREHGAYAMMAFPQITALLLGPGTRAAILLALGVLGMFLAHEPVLVTMGRRGTRIRRDAGPWALRQGVLLAGLSVAAGVAGLVGGPVDVLVAALAVIPAALLALRRMIQGDEKSAAGEVLVVLTFAAASIPIALANRVPPAAALTAAGVWFLAFTLGTLAVRALIARFKTRSPEPARRVIALACALILAGTGVAVLRGGTATAMLGLLPPGFLVAGVLAGGLTSHKLRTLGWSMATADVLVLAILLVVLR